MPWIRDRFHLFWVPAETFCQSYVTYDIEMTCHQVATKRGENLWDRTVTGWRILGKTLEVLCNWRFGKQLNGYSDMICMTSPRKERTEGFNFGRTSDSKCCLNSMLSGADPGFGVRGGEIRRGVWGPPRSPVRSRAEPWWGGPGGEAPGSSCNYKNVSDF